MAEIGSLKHVGVTAVSFSATEIAIGTKKGFVNIHENDKNMKLLESRKIFEGPVSLGFKIFNNVPIRPCSYSYTANISLFTRADDLSTGQG